MVKQTIQIFSRVKPTKAKTGLYEIDEDDSGSPRLTFTVPKDLAVGLVNNKKENYKFRFQRVFDQKTKQEEVFEHVGQPVVDNVLSGYNGTIFAYGQTGSGKTFTITGGPEKYADRGIIPRTLSYIFQQFEQNPDYVYTCHISYLEIYNESGYDLLDPKHESSKLEDLPKVHLMEDSDQNIHLKNLSTHQANNEEEALNLLFLGDTNRMIAETPMNQASTRSHCIFTIHVSSRQAVGASIRRSKLHLVDLAGSERVAKTGVAGTLLAEAKYINLSLHFLEQVIVTLSEKGRSHIPYRNSMMTSVLRDSLGGNCMTTMIATCSAEKKNIDESISTCRFAQRVAMIKNDAILNEELDPKLLIAKLKAEIQELKSELAIATGEQRSDELTQAELDRCRQLVKEYLEEPGSSSTLDIGADMRKIQFCYSLLKEYALEQSNGSQSQRPRDSPEPTEPAPDSKQLKKLNDLIQQRDNEINILVNMLKKEKKRAADALSRLEEIGVSAEKRASSTVSDSHIEASHKHRHKRNGAPRESWQSDRPMDPKDESTKQKILGDMSMGRQEAFEIFRRDYPQNSAIDEHKRDLKSRYQEAKKLGEVVNKSRTKINEVKRRLEQQRVSRVMQGNGGVDQLEPDEMENQLRVDLEHYKQAYKDTFNRLKVLKTEIEHLQHLLEKSKVKMMKDFEVWWMAQVSNAQNQQDHLNSSRKSAWQTPPSSSMRNSSRDLAPLTHNGGTNRAKEYTNHRPPDDGRNSKHQYDQRTSRSHTSNHSRVSEQSANGWSGDNSIPLTGDAEADADIMAFLRARQSVVSQSKGHH